MASVNKLNDINNVLHEHFKTNKTYLEEEDASMRIEVDKRGCKSLFYKFDKQLPREYKGGLFPFFAKKKGVCQVCDYLIFAEKNNNFFVLIVELKRGKQQTMPQLDAGECFADYIIATMDRITKQQSDVTIRKISVQNYRIRKKKTKQQEIEYDENNHYHLKDNKFHIAAFLK